MKVDINNAYTARNATIQNTEATQRNSTSAQGLSSTAATDSVKLSSAARIAGNVIQAQSLEPTFDTQRVAELKFEIHAGLYVANPERIAEKLQQFAL